MSSCEIQIYCVILLSTQILMSVQKRQIIVMIMLYVPIQMEALLVNVNQALVVMVFSVMVR